MGRRRDRRRAGPRLQIPQRLLDALPPAPPDLAVQVEQLSLGLTRGRTAAGRAYLQDNAARAAYAHYYLCANVPKLWPILDRLELPPRIRALELGGGPGTGVAALALWCAENDRELDLTTTDALPENVRDACALGERLGVRVRGKVHRIGDGSVGGPPVDLVLLMNVVNELPDTADAGLIAELERLCPTGQVVVVEPAARETSQRTLALRDRLVAAGWHIPFPCPHNGPCPARAADDWCHDEWWFDRPDHIEAVDRAIGLRREVLKATWFVATRQPTPRDPDLVRVVSAREDQKGRTRAAVCSGDGLAKLELQRRDETPSNRALTEASRFDLLRVRGTVPVSDVRRLPKDAVCERVEEGQ